MDWLDVVRRISIAASVSTLIAALLVGFILGALIGVNKSGPKAEAQPPQTPPAVQTTPPPTQEAPQPPQISLAAEPTSVKRNQDIRLTGAISSGESGVTLKVERSINGGEWGSFADVTTKSKDDGSFSVRIQTGRKGMIEFRVSADIDGTPVESQVATVEVS